MSKQLIIVLVLIAILVAGGTFWLLSPKSAPAPVTTGASSSGSSGFPSSGDKVSPKDDISGSRPAGTDTKTGNGFLAPSTPTQTFQELVKESVAGAVALERKRNDGTKTTFVRYVERATGHVREIVPGQNDAARISNTTVPKVAEAIFAPGGEALVLRILSNPFNEISTVLAQIVSATSTDGTTGKLDGVTLPEKVSAVALAPDGKHVFTLVPDTDGSRGIVQDMSGKGRHEILRSPLSEWLPDWTSANTITLTSRPSVGVPGFLYALPAEGGTLSRVLAGEGALLTNTSRDGTQSLVTEATKKGLVDYLYTPKSAQKTNFPIITLPEKCVWSHLVPTTLYCAVPDNSVAFTDLPDAWYRGDLSFVDSFWKVDTKTMKTTFLGTPPSSVDAITPTLSLSENMLLFMNKGNGHLWALKLTP